MEILEAGLILLVIFLIVLIAIFFIGYSLEMDFVIPVGIAIIPLALIIAVTFCGLQQEKKQNKMQMKTQCVQCRFEIENTDTLYCPNCGNKWMGEDKCTCENCIAVETTVCDCDKCKGLK